MGFNFIKDLLHDFSLYLKSHSLVFLMPPEKYRANVASGKLPIVLVPGLRTKWQFLRYIADGLAEAGHPIYIVKELGYNVQTIDRGASIIKDFLVKHDLRNVVLVAHSKGGLLSKYLMLFEDKEGRVKKAITIATPFHGTRWSEILLDKDTRELNAKNEIVKKMTDDTSVNNRIVSIYASYDSSVLPVESCCLEGAKNIQLAINGHHKILFDEQAREIVVREADSA